jgi:hypothetical protein
MSSNRGLTPPAGNVCQKLNDDAVVFYLKISSQSLQSVTKFRFKHYTMISQKEMGELLFFTANDNPNIAGIEGRKNGEHNRKGRKTSRALGESHDLLYAMVVVNF